MGASAFMTGLERLSSSEPTPCSRHPIRPRTSIAFSDPFALPTQVPGGLDRSGAEDRLEVGRQIEGISPPYGADLTMR
jgi:hypothetical protein